MKLQPIPVDKFSLPIISSFHDRWMLLTAGENTPGKFNPMTVSWGGLGEVWNKPLAMVMVRPSRYTFELIEKYPDFTLCLLPAEFKDQLTLCGTRSGRAIDKVKATGLTPIASSMVAAPAYEEAELIIECRKMYYDDIKPDHFLAPHIEGNYNGHDYHRLYFGEILAIHGTHAFHIPPAG
jgi:flavin reductase (DIM6/NTAB) family NADH-FMN oxidoreductase RutF